MKRTVSKFLFEQYQFIFYIEKLHTYSEPRRPSLFKGSSEVAFCQKFDAAQKKGSNHNPEQKS